MVSYRLVSLFSCLLLLVHSHLTLAQQAEPIASIDRSVISVEDTLILTIRVNDTGNIPEPDTRPLEQDFNILGSSQSSRHSFVNGRATSSTEWTIPIIPKRKGNLTIPPIKVGAKQTQRLSVNVQAAIPRSLDQAEPVFLESDVKKEMLYVQQQLIFTVRVFQSIQLDNMSLSDISLDQALVEKLSQNTFQRRIGNTPYRVHEIRYAIFPQQSGTLTIPEVVFSANEVTQQRGFFSMSAPGKPIRRLSQQHEVSVLKPPAKAKAAYWLPAESLRLEETWSGDLNQLRVGDSITRTLTVKARGLLGSQLPPHDFEQIPGVRLYPDQGKADNTLSEQGASSIRVDSTALIPTREGPLELPAIRIQWWDTRAAAMREATVPAQTLNILPALNNGGSSAPYAPDSTIMDTGMDATGKHAISQPQDTTPWKIATIVLTLLWLGTLLLWRYGQAHSIQKSSTPANNKPEKEKPYYEALLKSCRENNPQALRQSLISWADVIAEKTNIISLDDVNMFFRDAELSPLIDKLQAQLYSKDQQLKVTLPGGQWLAVLKRLRAASKKHAPVKQQDALPSLYPS